MAIEPSAVVCSFVLLCELVIRCYGSDNIYGLCDVGDIISHSGSIIGNKGVDCARVLLAPKGYRIEITLQTYRTTRDADLYFYDGGTRYEVLDRDNKFVKIIRNHVFSEPQVMTSTSSALLVYASRHDKGALNMTFVMFRQDSNRCQCLPVNEGASDCTLTTRIFRGDALERRCTVTCKEGYFLPAGTSVLTGRVPYVLKCSFDGKNGEWIAVNNHHTLLDENLITCSKFHPTNAAVSGFTFNYNSVPCLENNTKFIQDRVLEYILNSTNVPSFGECFKVNKKQSPNCTVERLNASCSNINSGQTSQIKLVIRDNIEHSDNVNVTKKRYKELIDLFTNDLANGLLRFIHQNLSLANVSADTVTKLPESYRVISCPPNEISPYYEYQSLKGCIACPKHSYRVPDLRVYQTCKNCPNGTQREIQNKTCVPGLRSYPKPSNNYCQHTCDLGKYFNFSSSLCEWCPFGFYQNSSSADKPVCQNCPNGTTTGFVGAKSAANCIRLCAAGQYLDSLTCKMCRVGYFMPNESNRFHKCLQCPLRKTTLNLGTNSSSGCVEKCSLGQYFNFSQAMCVSCPNNTYQDEVKNNNSRSCKNCPQKTVTVNIGSTTSTACLGPCVAGQYVDVQTKKCALCPKHTYHDVQEHVSFTCKPCEQYKITQNKGSTNISECIYTCGQGEFFNTTTNQCEKCSINMYQDQVGKDFCMPCSGKTFTLRKGSKQCISPCPYGQLLNKSAERCQDCPEGYYQNISDYQSERCFPCPLDFYNNKPGRRNCTACPRQTLTLATGASGPSDCINPCEPGTFLNKSSKSCQECLKGFYQDQQQYRHEFCMKCPSANLTTLGTGTSSIGQCVGHCASFPCLNGGECYNINYGFNCTCPKHLSGKRCEVIIDGENTDSWEVSIRFPNQVWNKKLSNPESQEFHNLASNVEDNVRKEFENDPNFRTVKLKEFTQGSVISNLELNTVYGQNFKAPVDTLSSAITDGKLGNNLTVDKSSFKVLNYTCTQPLGMEDGRIPDKAITSGNKENVHPPSYARLNRQGPGWVPQIVYLSDVYLQVDFQQDVELTAVATQGSSYDGGSWLNGYHLNYSSDGRKWMRYKGDLLYIKVFGGNTDVNSIVKNNIKYPVRTRYVRIMEYTFHNAHSFRIEFYGCPIPKTIILPTLVPLPTVGKGKSSTTKTSSTIEATSDVGLIVGVVLGIVAVVGLVIVVLVWWVKRLKNSHSFGHDSTVNAMQLTDK